jgi:6-pyruvoyltetrahydropterin/6-carboxytetrahydropterin synthase
VFTISVQGGFSAAHALMIGGAREPLHGHDWRVTVTLAGPNLDASGLLCDFHAVERALAAVTAGFHNAHLNERPPFTDRVNPSAENVARHIADRLAASLALRPGVWIDSVRVTESPGCEATFRPERTEGREGSR